MARAEWLAVALGGALSFGLPFPLHKKEGVRPLANEFLGLCGVREDRSDRNGREKRKGNDPFSEFL